MNYNNIRLPEEISIRKDLYNALQSDAVLKLANIAEHNVLKQSNKILQNIHSSFFFVTEQSSPRYYKIFHEVCERLEFDEPVRFYIKACEEMNAFSVMSQGGLPHAIVVNSMTLKILKEDELRQLIGHEIGHLIMRQGELFPILHTLGEQINENPSLNHKITFWQQLSELSADRFGFIAEPNLYTTITSSIKFSSGLSPEELADDFNLDFNAILHNAQETIETYKANYGVNDEAHPIEAIRLTALSYFGESILNTNNECNESELNDKMAKLIEVLQNVASDEMEVVKARFHASAGLIIAQADDKINDDELDFIYQNLSQYQIFPKQYLINIAQEDYVSIFEESVQKLIENDPENEELKEKILHRLIQISFADQNVRPKEIDIILDIASTLLGYSRKQAANIYLDSIHTHFMPNPEDVF